MKLFRETRRRLRYAVPPVLCACLMAYAGYHFVEGGRGLKAYRTYEEKISDAERELATVRNERERLETRVGMLREDTLDMDILEERVRLMLMRGRTGEIVVLYTRPLGEHRD